MTTKQPSVAAIMKKLFPKKGKKKRARKRTKRTRRKSRKTHRRRKGA